MTKPEGPQAPLTPKGVQDPPVPPAPPAPNAPHIPQAPQQPVPHMLPLNCIYRKVESGNLINKIMMRQEIDQDIDLDKMDNTSGDENPYRELIVNNAGKIETTLSQVEQWSILSNVINYVQYDKHSKNFHTVPARHINKTRNKTNSKKNDKERPISEIDFRNKHTR